MARRRQVATWWLRWSVAEKAWSLYHGAIRHVSAYRVPGGARRNKRQCVQLAARAVKGWAIAHDRAPARLNIGGVSTGSRVLKERSYFCDRPDRRG